MIGWTELIGRFISFMVEKLAGKQIDLTMDDRRKAARQFFSLYHSVTDLETLTRELVIELREVSQLSDPAVTKQWLRDVAFTVDETSQRFLESTQGLRRVLEIFDPVLAITLSGLEASKFSFLLEAAVGFSAAGDNESQEIEYTYPGEKVGQRSLAQSYQWHFFHPFDPTKQVEWPEGALLDFIEPTAIESDQIRLKDPDSLLRLAALLEKHLQSLSDARTALGDFLRQRFSLEDLLARQMPVAKFDGLHAMHRMSDAACTAHIRWFAGQPVRRFQRPERDDSKKQSSSD